MLQVFSPEVAALLDKATEARAHALQAPVLEDRQFWLEMERKWLELARSSEQVQRTDDLLAFQGRKGTGVGGA